MEPPHANRDWGQGMGAWEEYASLPENPRLHLQDFLPSHQPALGLLGARSRTALETWVLADNSAIRS
jgi:hypothetical protein